MTSATYPKPERESGARPETRSSYHAEPDGEPRAKRGRAEAKRKHGNGYKHRADNRAQHSVSASKKLAVRSSPREAANTNAAPDPQPTTCCTVEGYLAALTSIEERKAAIGRWLDGKPPSALAFWTHVQHVKILQVGDWTFVAEPEAVERVLRDDAHFSVKEYNRRMRATSGRFYLGMDPPEHTRDAAMGAIIPSWNTFQDYPPKDESSLSEVRYVAETACRRALASAGMVTLAARHSTPNEPCALPLALLFGPVLDACAAAFFGLSGPSTLSFVQWAADVTLYHFRVNANEAVDRSGARDASALFRAHALTAIGSIDDSQQPEDLAARKRRLKLKEVVAKLRSHNPAASEEALAGALINILTGSLTATFKAFAEGLAMYGASHADAQGRVLWPESLDSAVADPLYQGVIASTLSRARRGSLDAVYRTYVGARTQPFQGSDVALKQGDRVIVWLGGSLAKDRDNLFGIGIHKCPGMDMGKAIMEGALRALTQLRGSSSPRLRLVEGSLALLFDEPQALVDLLS